ncbi:MAG: hypothetical protein AAF810_21915 [Cyanobacteria bacterium P01_D01_bin.36]
MFKASSSLVFFRDDGKPVYSFTSSGSLKFHASHSITPEIVKSIEDWYQILIADQDLTQIKRLLVSSLQIEGDKLRSFLSAWTALEIFINKTFKGQYEKAFFEQLEDDSVPAVLPSFIERIFKITKDNYGWDRADRLDVLKSNLKPIRSYMNKGRYKIADKFSLIASLLSLETAEADLKNFKHIKKKRDRLFHGEDVNEDILPVEMAQSLLRKYLVHHLATQHFMAADW